MSTGIGSLKELREKRKLERAASEHGNSNKISPDRTGIHSLSQFRTRSYRQWHHPAALYERPGGVTATRRMAALG